MNFEHHSVVEEMKRLHSSGQSHEDDFLCFRKFAKAGARALLVDVGANAGQSAISFLASCPHGKVSSYEPNKLYEPVLREIRDILGVERFDYSMFGLSDSESSLPLYIPSVDGTIYMQESSMTLEQFEKPWVKARLESYGQRLEILPKTCDFKCGDECVEEVDIIKIDAEGAEMKVLAGLSRTIATKRPVFIIENNDYHHVTSFLEAYGYDVFKYNPSIHKLESMSGATTNCFYLMPDKHEWLLSD
jgi:FkbM family methyltransferase